MTDLEKQQERVKSAQEAFDFVSFGINGITEVRCIEGYKFVISQDGVTKQILDEFGKGAKCDTVPQPIK
jgi:hypothetical protein